VKSLTTFKEETIMKNLRTIAVLAVAGLMLTLSAPANFALAAALPANNETTQSEAVTVLAQVTLTQAIEAALSANTGAIALEASLETENGAAVYIIKMLGTDGKTFEGAVDGLTGAMVNLPADLENEQDEQSGDQENNADATDDQQGANAQDQTGENADLCTAQDETARNEKGDSRADKGENDEVEYEVKMTSADGQSFTVNVTAASDAVITVTGGDAENEQDGETESADQAGKDEVDGSDNEQLIAAAAATARISLLQAIEAARASAPGSVALEASLDSENGIILYTVSMAAADGTNSEVKVDAATGALIITTDLENVEHAD
jgi:uncharacterized membrane protein YkoI